MNIFSFSRPSRLLGEYGIFAIICHATFILLAANTSPHTDPHVLFKMFFPMIEHSLMSFIIVLFGITAFEYIDKKMDKE